MKIKTVTIVTSGCHLYMPVTGPFSLSLSLYPSFIERFKANKVTKRGNEKEGEGRKDQTSAPPRKNGEIFPMITLV